MNKLLSTVLDAHGGLDTWRAVREFKGHMSGSGPLFDLVGCPGGLSDVNFSGLCHEQQISEWPIARPGQRSVVRAAHVVLQNEAGETVSERADPRSSYPVDLTTGWDDVQLAYFAGYAMWNYLNAPFIFMMPGMEVHELPPADHDQDQSRRLLVRYPADFATHSREETFYISEQGLIVRVDYAPEVTGNRPAANFASDHRKVDGGLVMPTRRTVKPRRPDGTAEEMVVISVEIDELAYA